MAALETSGKTSLPGPAAPRLRVRGPRHLIVRLAASLISAVVLMPVIVLVLIAVEGSAEEWRYIVQSILPKASVTTLSLLAGVAVSTAIVGVTTAWLVVAFDFPLRRLFSWALV